MQDMECPEILFTYSTWVNMEQLEAYRQSALFRETWQKTKILFSGKPEAWSLVKQDIQ
jgi:quinol monooxygenase YgiN